MLFLVMDQPQPSTNKTTIKAKVNGRIWAKISNLWRCFAQNYIFKGFSDGRYYRIDKNIMRFPDDKKCKLLHFYADLGLMYDMDPAVQVVYNNVKDRLDEKYDSVAWKQRQAAKKKEAQRPQVSQPTNNKKRKDLGGNDDDSDAANDNSDNTNNAQCINSPAAEEPPVKKQKLNTE